jgi:hypothetical protein
MLGIDRPPLATTNDGAVKVPRAVTTVNPASPWPTRSMLQPVSTRTPAAAHSSSSIFTISFEDSSQNS